MLLLPVCRQSLRLVMIWQTFKAALKTGVNAVETMPDWEFINGLNTNLAAPVKHFEKPEHYSRKKIRSMGRVSLMATRTTELALEQAGLLEHPSLTNGDTGIAFGSSIGSTAPLIPFGRMMETGEMTGVTATSYIQMMAHTAPVNVGVFFWFKRPGDYHQFSLYFRLARHWLRIRSN